MLNIEMKMEILASYTAFVITKYYFSKSLTLLASFTYNKSNKKGIGQVGNS